jgi:hypothetical protein
MLTSLLRGDHINDAAESAHRAAAPVLCDCGMLETMERRHPALVEAAFEAQSPPVAARRDRRRSASETSRRTQLAHSSMAAANAHGGTDGISCSCAAPHNGGGSQWLGHKIKVEKIGAGERHHCRRWIALATDALEEFAERHRSLIEQHLQDAHAQSDWHGDLAIRPDKVRIRIARLAADFFGGQNDPLQSELGERNLGEHFLFDIADVSSRNNVEQEPAVVAPYDDGIEFYLLGRNRRRRDVSNRAHSRIERRLDERVP